MKEHTPARARGNRAHTNHSRANIRPCYDDGVFSTLIPELQRSLADEGYQTPTPIQEECIPHLLEGRDLLGTAQTGTGKTAAFTLPVLQRLKENPRKPRRGTPRVLILAPTRELAAQIGASVGTYGRFLRASHTVIFGGVNQLRQVKALSRGVDILVATPGRLLDLMQQGIIHLDDVEVFILDEVDRMLDMGFIPDIKRVLSHIPADRQTLFFSATMAPKIEELARTMVRKPVRVSIAPDGPAVEKIDQKVLFVAKENKDALLASLLGDEKIRKAIVFTQMKHVANRVVKKIGVAGVKGVAIHGNKSQAARTRALDGFKRGQYRVLVATDVAARGLDVDDITHVINYNLPVEAETYVHRIGRTARAGAEGSSISFCSVEERACLTQIEDLLGKPVPADLKHQWHSESARASTAPPPARKGGGGKRSSGRGSVIERGNDGHRSWGGRGKESHGKGSAGRRPHGGSSSGNRRRNRRGRGGGR